MADIAKKLSMPLDALIKEKSEERKKQAQAEKKKAEQQKKKEKAKETAPKATGGGKKKGGKPSGNDRGGKPAPKGNAGNARAGSRGRSASTGGGDGRRGGQQNTQRKGDSRRDQKGGKKGPKSPVDVPRGGARALSAPRGGARLERGKGPERSAGARQKARREAATSSTLRISAKKSEKPPILLGARVVATNLPTGITRDELLEIFGSVGDVQSIEMVGTRTAPSAQVTYLRKDSAARAVEEFDGRFIENRRASVTMSRATIGLS